MVPLGRSFRGLWFATGAANLSDGIVLFAFPLLALAAGAGGGEVALITTLATLAWPVLGIHGGWAVDHFGARRVLLVVNLIRGCAFAGLAVAALFGSLPYWLLAVAAVGYGVAEVLVDTSLFSAIPGTVVVENRGRANARIEATINVANQFVGAPLAGAIIAIGHSLVLAVGGFLYLLSLAGVAFVRRLAPPPPPDPDRRIRAGMVFLWRNRTLRWLTIITAAMNIVWSMWVAVFVLYIVAPGPLGASAFEYGLVLSSMAAGGLLASLAYSWFRRWFGATYLFALDLIGTILLVLAPALGLNLIACAVAAAIAGAGSSIWRILLSTVRQHLTPERLLGRAYSASRAISWGALPLGSALAGVVIELFGLGVVFWLAVGIAAATALGFWVFAWLHPLAGADGER